MKARFARSVAPLCRARRASTLGFLLTMLAGGTVSVQGTPEQRRASTPDDYRFCAGEIQTPGRSQPVCDGKRPA